SCQRQSGRKRTTSVLQVYPDENESRVQHEPGTRTDDAQHAMQRVRARQPEERADEIRVQNTAAHRVARTEQDPDVADRIRTDNAAAHRDAYARLDPAQRAERVALERNRRADERASRPLLDRF